MVFFKKKKVKTVEQIEGGKQVPSPGKGHTPQSNTQVTLSGCTGQKN